jgi:hypothetical protein
MKAKTILAAIFAVILLSGTATSLLANWNADAEGYAEAYPDRSDKSDRAERESDLYGDGTDAIDDGDWEDAIKYFSQVAEMKGKRADGALYWTAYALAKLGRRSQALQTVATLKKAYPSSKWLDDARALDLEVRQAGGEHVAPERVDDDELKVMAINSLMNTDPERAYPLLEKILRGNGSPKVKEQALFILSQSESPRAQQLIASIARGATNAELQKAVVKYLGIDGTEHNRQLLAELYSSAASRDVKKEVLQAFMIAGDQARVVNAARSEKDPELRVEAIRTLGVMNARGELASLYANETSRNVREAVIEALFVAGDFQRMSDLARGEQDPELRADAIRKLGLMGKQTTPLLLSLYNSDASIKVKRAVIEGLFVQDNARALIDLAKKETNRELKRDALQKLSVMNNKDAIDYMLQILDQD